MKNCIPHLRLFKMAAAETDSTFLYFAFGSNLLTQRIHINNPSARKVDVGKLNDYRLGFSGHGARWKGATATILHESGKHVYGVLWELQKRDLESLDNQEGVLLGIYQPLYVDIELSTGEIIKARTYQLQKVDKGVSKPSFVYLNVIINGALENGLPVEYVDWLKQIEHNNYRGEVDVNVSLK